jgi:hypothetical protein
LPLGQRADFRTDFLALGLLLYELVSATRSASRGVIDHAHIQRGGVMLTMDPRLRRHRFAAIDILTGSAP